MYKYELYNAAFAAFKPSKYFARGAAIELLPQISSVVAIAFITSLLKGSLLFDKFLIISFTATFLSSANFSAISLKSGLQFVTCCLIGSIYLFHAFCLLSFINNLAFISISASSYSSASAFSRIHSLICLMQSHSFSQASLSGSLYLSWLPEVECPCGCVISSI